MEKLQALGIAANDPAARPRAMPRRTGRRLLFSEAPGPRHTRHAPPLRRAGKEQDGGLRGRRRRGRLNLARPDRRLGNPRVGFAHRQN